MFEEEQEAESGRSRVSPPLNQRGSDLPRVTQPGNGSTGNRAQVRLCGSEECVQQGRTSQGQLPEYMGHLLWSQPSML